MTLSGFAILVLTFAAGVTIIAYEDHARNRGWPVGSLFRGPHAALMALAVLGVLFSLGLAFFKGRWWHPLPLILLGYVAYYSASELFKSRVQLISAIALLVGLVLSVFYVL